MVSLIASNDSSGSCARKDAAEIRSTGSGTTASSGAFLVRIYAATVCQPRCSSGCALSGSSHGISESVWACYGGLGKAAAATAD